MLQILCYVQYTVFQNSQIKFFVITLSNFYQLQQLLA